MRRRPTPARASPRASPLARARPGACIRVAAPSAIAVGGALALAAVALPLLAAQDAPWTAPFRGSGVRSGPAQPGDVVLAAAGRERPPAPPAPPTPPPSPPPAVPAPRPTP